MTLSKLLLLIRSNRAHWIFGLICLSCAGLAFPGLDHMAMWIDEAETAFVARGVLFSGWPVAYDGNHLYPGLSHYYNAQFLWMELPWIQFYLTALSFLLLGAENAFTARLPFVIVGLLTVPIVYAISRRLFDARVARTATILLLLSVPYLLHIRQCRYFALLAFGTAWGIWAYLRFTRGERYAAAHLTGAAVFLFHSHYAYFFAFMGGLSLWVVLFDRPRTWKPLLVATGLIFALTFPWALYADLFGRHSTHGGWSVWNVQASLGYYATVLHMYMIPILVFPLIVLALGKRRWRAEPYVAVVIPVMLVGYMIFPTVSGTDSVLKYAVGGGIFILIAIWAYLTWRRSSLPQYGGRLLIVFIIGALFSMALVIPNNAFRYVVGIVPLIYMLMAVLLVALWDRSKALGMLGGMLIISSNLLNALPFTLLHWLPVDARSLEPVIAFVPSSWITRLTGHGADDIQAKLAPELASMDQALAAKAAIKSPIFDYVYEITHPYVGPVEAVVAYLRTHARAGETLSSDGDAVTLAFHTGLHIRPVSIKDDRLKADWISLRPHHFYATHTAWWIRRFYDEVLSPSYKRIELDAPDLPTLFYHLPDPDTHYFRVDSADYPRMMIFRRKGDG